MKKFIGIMLSAALFAGTLPAWAAGSDTVYTFSTLKTATKGNTEDVTDAALTDKISVTTSGPANYKIAAITDIEHNGELGTRPVGGGFTASSPYLYLSTASTNNDTVITLTVPEIAKGSKVEFTYAKPIVTNNGSTRRNQNDPYTYLEVGGRYISISGGEFDTWQTDYVITAEDTNTIVFHADKWGSVAIEKISISDGSATPLRTLDISTQSYANVTVNGIKHYADSEGKITDYIEDGKQAVIKAEKDGYESAETTVTATEDLSPSLPLDMTVDADYYESDFGTASGTLALDGEFMFGKSETLSDITDIFGNVTFSDGGTLGLIMADGKTPFEMKYKQDEGIYLDDALVTTKDNMEFHAVLDRALKSAVVKDDGSEKSYIYQAVSPFAEGYNDTDSNAVIGIAGTGVTVDAIGVDYPKLSDMTIDGPDKLSRKGVGKYTVSMKYKRPADDVEFSVISGTGAEFEKTEEESDTAALIVDDTAQDGTITIQAKFGDTTAEKSVEILSAPKITQTEYGANTINLYDTALFRPTSFMGEYGNKVYPELKDFTSSDTSVITIDADGKMCAVGVGKATISANAFTGVDNNISEEFTVERYYRTGISDSQPVYVEDDFPNDANIVGYKLNYREGDESVSKAIELSDIPAQTITADGMLITAEYRANTLTSVHARTVKAGDTAVVSDGARSVYLSADGRIEKLTESDTVVKGFTVDIGGGKEYEIDPIYRYDNVGDVADGKTLDDSFANGYYTMTFKKGETRRADIYVNGFMVGNNVDQADADRKVTDGALYTAEDLKIHTGEITVSMTDGSTLLDYVTVERNPDYDEYYNRPQRVYIIGDSLACEYYGTFEQEVGGGRSGWGQQLPSFLNIPVTNLANSGQFAAGLYKTAFPSVIENGEAGDILLIECAYNDRNYSTRSEMTECIKDMIAQCEENEITPILVTPNASRHDYKPSVAWSSYMRDIAVDTGCQLIDLSQESYDFLYSLYGDDEDNVVTMNYNLTAVGGDTLHSSYAGAYKWASIVAQDLKDLGYGDIVNTDFKYDFTDTLGNKITAEVK